MNARRVVLASTVVALATSAAVYPWLPAVVPVHFDLAGRADGFAPRALGAFLLPGALLGALVLSRVTRDGAAAVALAVSSLFLAALDVLVLRAALGDGRLGSGAWLAVGALLVGLGLVLPRIRKNRWIGVRTPWSMRSPEAWARTQRVGGAAMFACGALVLLSAGSSGAAATAVRGVAMAGAVFVSVAGSWWVARRVGPS